MHLILLNQFFWPDSAATSQILTDVARECASLGCQVTAICGAPDYASQELDSKPEVRIIRTRNFRFGRSHGTRIASYLSFFLGTLWQGLRLRQPDVILSLTTPPLLSMIGSVLKTLRGSRHYIWEMDVYPDVAIALGVLSSNGVLAYITRYLANWSRRQADGIIVLGEEMKTLLIDQGISPDKVHVCENWADRHEITPLPFPDGPLAIHYSGNLGRAHDSETIRAAMLHFRNNAEIRFLFAGSGPARPKLEAFCRENDIANVSFRPYCDRSKLGASLAEGHIGLVSQLTETLGCIVPSKTYGILAAGRPVLFIGPKEATPARHIERYGCGWQIDPGDAAGLITLLDRLVLDRSPITKVGLQARQTFEENFDRAIGIDRIQQILGVAGSHASESAYTEHSPAGA